MSKQRCSGKVFDGFRDARCSFMGKVCRDGKWYCKRHDPVAIAEKDAARHAQWEAELKDRQLKLDRRAAEQSACEGVDTSDLRPGLLRELLDKGDRL